MKLMLLIVFLITSLTSFSAVVPVEYSKSPFPGSILHIPSDSKPHPGVILLHGSEGGSQGYINTKATLLAASGYSVLVYCYFDCNRSMVGPRQSMKNIEVTKLFDALKWFKKSKYVAGKKVAVYGFSKGAELTLIAGAMAHKAEVAPDVLIAHSPFDKFGPIWNWDWRNHRCWLCNKEGGCPNYEDYDWNKRCGENPRTIDYNVCAWLYKGEQLPLYGRIEIEKFDGPILLSHGLKDEVWPAEQTKRIEKTLREAGKNPEVYYLPNCGHSCSGKYELERKQFVYNFLERYLKN